MLKRIITVTILLPYIFTGALFSGKFRCCLVTPYCVVFFQGSFSYSNCACVAKTGQTSGEATKGSCGFDCRFNLLVFLIILALMPFTACVNDIPATIVTLRFVMYSIGLDHVLRKMLLYHIT